VVAVVALGMLGAEGPAIMRLPPAGSLPLAFCFLLAACSSRTTGSATKTAPTAPISAPEPGACEAGAIAEIGAGYALASVPGAIWVDSSGVLINLVSTPAGESVIVSGTTAGGFSTLTTLSGSLSPVGANASTVFFANDDVIESVPRAGGQVSDLGAADSEFTSLALAGSTVYEATLSGISSMPANGGFMTVIHSGGSALDLITGNGGASLYWITGNTDGPYYVRTTSLAGAFTASTVATMPGGTIVRSLAVGGEQVVVAATTIGENLAVSTAIFTVSTAGGAPVSVDTLSVDPEASTSPTPVVAIANGAAYYSLGAGVKKLALDGSNATSTVAAATSTIAGIGANPAADGAVYVVGQCVYVAP
jgi:hypothetical protein